MAGVCDPDSVTRASGSASTKVKEEFVDSVEHLVFWFTNPKVETVDSDIDNWEESSSGNLTGLVAMSPPVIPGGFVEESPLVEPMA